MKKSKGILTPAEKQVAKKNRKLVGLFIVLILSVCINVLFVMDIDIPTFTNKMVKVEEKHSDVDRALTAAYNEAEVVSFPDGSIRGVEVYIDNTKYRFELNGDQMEFYTYDNSYIPDKCSFVKEKYDELIYLLNSAELKELTLESYPNEDGKLIDFNPENYIIIDSDNGKVKIYPPHNWGSIVGFCQEIEEAAKE